MAVDTYVIFYPDMIVHRAGCADVARESRRYHPDTIVTQAQTTLAGALEAELGDPTDESTLAGMGYDAGSYNVKPCAR